MTVLVSSAFCDVLSLIPRRVSFSQVSTVSDLDENQKALTGALIDYLYTSISSLQPIVRVEDTERAHSIVAVSLQKEGDAVRIEVALKEAGETRLKRDYRLARDGEDLEGYTQFINETAEVMAPYLEMVKPEVTKADFSEEEKMVEIIEETDYADELNRRFELTLWLSGITRVYHDPNQEDPELLATRALSVFPIVLDAAYYFNRSFGLYLSLFVDYGDFFAFDMIEVMDERIGKAESTNLFLLPGIGITYRTLGVVSAQFQLGLYYGAVRVDAKDNVEGVAEAGEVAWTQYSLLSLNTIVAWNMFPFLSLKTKIGMSFDLRQLILMETGIIPYDMSYNGFFFSIFSIGVSYRP